MSKLDIYIKKVKKIGYERSLKMLATAVTDTKVQQGDLRLIGQAIRIAFDVDTLDIKSYLPKEYQQHHTNFTSLYSPIERYNEEMQALHVELVKAGL